MTNQERNHFTEIKNGNGELGKEQKEGKKSNWYKKTNTGSSQSKVEYKSVLFVPVIKIIETARGGIE